MRPREYGLYIDYDGLINRGTELRNTCVFGRMRLVADDRKLCVDAPDKSSGGCDLRRDQLAEICEISVRRLLLLLLQRRTRCN